MPCRPLTTAFLAVVVLAGGSNCSHPTQEGGTRTISSTTASSHEARIGTTSDVRNDENVVFFPTYACQVDGVARWNMAIHGTVFEPELGSLKRAAVLELLCAALGLPREQAESDILRERARAFLVDNERGKNIVIRVGDKVYGAGTSGANGHFSTTLQFVAAEADRLRRDAAEREGWLGFRTVLPAGDDRTFAGQVQWIPPEGLSIISDIDDTIKISNVQDRRALVANTFLRELRPVPGMAPLYRKWADAGAVFHYVSGSPWQLHQMLAAFCRSEGFPTGSFHMKRFRLTDSSAQSFFDSQEGYKTEVIERILADFPHRSFTLLGDSGEQDPEIYAAVARKHPGQIQHIFIRNVGGRGAEPVRFQQAFEGISAARWQVFEHSDELPQEL